MDDTRVKSLNLRILMMASLVWLTSTGSATSNPGEVALEMTGRTIEAVELAEGHAVVAHGTRIVFSGRPQARRSAIAIKYRPADWEGFERLTLRLKPSVAMGRESLRVALRNDRRYHLLTEAALAPLRPPLEADCWNEMGFDLAAEPRKKIREVRVYLNHDGALMDQELAGELELRLTRRSGLVKALPLGQPRQRVLPRPYVAARAHVKYALQNNWFFDPDYYADRILMLNRELEKGSDLTDCYGVGGPANFARTLELMRMSGADGIAMLNIDTSQTYLNRTLSGIRYAEALGLTDAIVPEISIFSKGTGGGYLDRQIRNQGVQAVGTDALVDRLLPAAVTSPATVKHRGKALISSYQACVLPPEFWRDYLAQCRTRVGDRFLFLAEVRTMFYNAMRRYHRNGGLSRIELDEMREYLNAYLAVCDGIHFAGQNHLVEPPRTNRLYTAFYRDIVIPLLNEAMKLPQNQGKLLGLGISKGYVNHLSGDVQHEDGTRNLRTVIETATRINPDYIVFVEWNEIKERTNLEPTVADGRSSMRILRHYLNGLKGKANEPLPGDDPSVPNLILSYRPQLAPGEAMNFELLNVPDTASPGQGDYRVRLELLNVTGQVVASFPERRLSATRLAETRFLTYADAELPPHFVLLPRLTVTAPDGVPHLFDAGFPYLNISACELRDDKYCKIPLRDLPRTDRVEFTAELTQGNAAVSAAVKTQDDLASVEVLRNRRPIYSAARAPEFRLVDDECLVKVTWNAWKEARSVFPILTLTAPDGAIRRVERSNRGWGRDFSLELHDPRRLTIGLPELTHGARRGVYLIVDSKTTGLTFAGGTWSQTLSLAKLRKTGRFRFSPGHGLNLMVEDFRRIPDLPPHLNTTSCTFAETLPDVSSRDILCLRAITTEGRIFRSPPIVFADCSKTREIAVWNDRDNRPGRLTVPLPAATPIVYTLNPDYGALLHAPGFDSRYDVQLGGSTNYGDPFFNRDNFPPESTVLQPAWRTGANGETTLHFDGRGNHLIVPLYATPSRAFTLECELKPESGKPQLLFRSYSKTAGALMVVLDQGKLRIRFLNHENRKTTVETPPLLTIGAWQRLIISFDMAQFTISVDDHAPVVLPCLGKPVKMSQLVFGGVGNARYYHYFRGGLKSLTIRPY